MALSMKIFITGGSGLLGSKVAEIAQARGDEVFSGYAHNLPEYGRAGQSLISWMKRAYPNWLARLSRRLLFTARL